MENELLQYYINAIDSILGEKKLLSEEEYNYAYRLVYSKYKSLGNMASVIEKAIDKKMSKHFNVVKLFKSDAFSNEEKQIIINYWVSSSFANAANKNKISNRTPFINIVNRDYERLSSILSRKQYTDNNGVIYNGSDIFGSFKDKQEALNEFALAAVGKIALSAAVWLGLDALSPKIAKQVPGICSLVRQCAEKYPTATKIANYTISPFDLDEFIKQDKINKGEEVDADNEYEDNEENFDDYDVVMENGKVYNEHEEEVVIDTNSPSVGKIYKGTFKGDDGTVYNYTFEDRDKK